MSHLSTPLRAIPAPRQPSERVGGALRDHVLPERAIVEMWSAAVVTCYPRPMPSLDLRHVGDGTRAHAWGGGRSSTRCLEDRSNQEVAS